MFDMSWIADLDADAACAAVTATQEELREREWQELALAAHWVTLHDPSTIPLRAGPVLPAPNARSARAATAPRR